MSAAHEGQQICTTFCQLPWLGERQTEDLKAPCSIHGDGKCIFAGLFYTDMVVLLVAITSLMILFEN